MHRRVLLSVVLLLALSALTYGEHVDLRALGEDVVVTVEESNDIRTVIRFEVGGFEKEAVDINGQTYYKIALSREGILLNESEPELPKVCRSIIIPDNAKMDIRVLSSDYVDIANTPVVPSKGNLLRTVNPEDVPYTFGPVYSSNEFYPTNTVSLGNPYILRDYRGAVVEVLPFQVKPNENTLRVYTSVTVEVVAVGAGEINVFENRQSDFTLLPEFDNIYESRFINYDFVQGKYTPVQEEGDLLVICYADFMDEMTPFVNWKNQKGLPTTIVNVSDIGNNSTAIKSYIQNIYNTSDLGYVLLVGDAAQVATPYASGGSSDPSYALMTTDDYPDLFVGRFSAENGAQVTTQVNRTITYEKNPLAGSWFHKGTGVGSNQGPGHNGGEYDNEHLDYIRDSLLTYTYTDVDQIYDPTASSAAVAAALNDGRSIINYTGHGSTTAWSSSGFSNTDVNALVNDNMLPFIISVACVNGQFDGYTCFGEAWLRATNGSNPTGAIGAYMSSINQSWNPPMDAQDEVNHLLIQDQMNTYGGLCFNGSCKMIDINGSDGVSMYNTWHIFGDPSVQVRTDVPEGITVNHGGAVFFAMDTYDVEVVGQEGALCALYHNGELFGSAYTGPDGTASIPIEGLLPIGQSITLTVTGYNLATVEETVVVTSDLAIIVPNPLQDTKDYTNDYTAECMIYTEATLDTDSLLLYYSIDGGGYTADLLQAGAGADEFYGTIPAQSPGTQIDYYFFAKTTSGLADTTEVYSFSVIDYGLLLEPGYQTQTAPVGDTLTFTLTVTNDGVLDDTYSIAVEDADWATTVWDATGTTEITETDLLSADETFDFQVQVVVPSSWEGETDSIRVVTTSVGDPSFAAGADIISVSAGQPWPIPFTESFLTADLDMTKWEDAGGAEVSTDGIAEPSAPYSISLDGNPSGGDALESEAINLRNESNVILRYYFQQTGDGDSPESGDDLEVEYLDSNGIWHALDTHPGADPDMTVFEENIVQLPAGAMHAGMRIRFTNTATAGSYDDWFVDDIYVGHPPSYEVQVMPSFQEQYGPAEGEAAFTLYVKNKGLYSDQFSLYDSLAQWNVTFWDESATSQITSTGIVEPLDSVMVIAKVEIPAATPLNSEDTIMVMARSNGDPSISSGAFICAISAGFPASVPWEEQFPTATLDMSKWMVNDGGAIASNAYNTPSGTYSLLLDGGCDTLISQLIDLTGQDAALLTYYFERKGPGDSPETGDDLVFEYQNSSGEWIEVSRQLGSGEDMMSFEYVEVALTGDALHETFQLRVHSFGNAAGDDYWYVDNIRVDFAPSIAVTPASFDFQLIEGDSASSMITVQNGGPGTLNYTVQSVPVFRGTIGELFTSPYNYLEGYEVDELPELPKGTPDTRQGPAVERDAGGPDNFGYIWVDSDEPGGPAFDWIDIQAVGTEVPIRDAADSLGDDNHFGPIPIGFSFSYYGVSYDEIYIASNGFIGFGPDAGYYSRNNTILPDSDPPNNILAWCWDDLDPTNSNNISKVFYHSDGNRLVIQFVDYSEYQASVGDVINAEVILYASGRIKFQYQSVAAGFDADEIATIGIENEAGDDGLTVAFNTSYLKDNLAVEFSAPAQWLTLTPTSGTIEPMGENTITARVNTFGLDIGEYACAVNIYSNDPDTPDNPWSIPVSLLVEEEQQYMCGDCDGNLAVDIDDVVMLIEYVFGSGPAPEPVEAGDVDCNDSVDIDDIVYTIAYVFSGGPEPCADCP